MEAAVAAARAGRAAGVPVTTDIEAVKPGTLDLLDAVTVPIFAEQVPHALTGEPDIETALRRLRQRHDGLLCVTLGPQGAAVLAGDRFIHQPGFRVDAIDTTGAGDVFRAGFIYALLRGDAPADDPALRVRRRRGELHAPRRDQRRAVARRRDRAAQRDRYVARPRRADGGRHEGHEEHEDHEV